MGRFTHLKQHQASDPKALFDWAKKLINDLNAGGYATATPGPTPTPGPGPTPTPSPPSRTFCTPQALQTGSSSSWTFTDHDIGAADADRLVLVAIHAGAAGGRTVTGVTLDGVAATVDTTTNVSVTVPTTYAWLIVPTGTVSDIVVTFSGVTTSCRIEVWSLYDLDDNVAPVDSDNTNQTTTGLTLTAEADGLAFAHMTSGAGSVTWTGFTEDYDYGSSTGASKVGTGTSETVSTSVANGTGRLSAITWR